MKQSRNYFYHWVKLQRRYRSVQSRWVTSRSNKLKRKLDILGRRLHSLNRKWKLGIAASALSCWLASMPAQPLQAQNTPFVPLVSPADLNGSNGFTIIGAEQGDQAGRSISNAGDINGDGIEDIIIGARGSSYVVFGSREGFQNSFDLLSLDGSNGFAMEGIVSLSYAAVSGAGDVNGDGFDDLIIGDSRSSRNGKSDSGSTYIVFGHDGEFSSPLRLSPATLDGSEGFVIDGESANDFFGNAVGAAGDLNGDGIGDIVIGAFGSNLNGNIDGASYVIFGSTEGFASPFDLSTLDGTNGIVLNGVDANYRTGSSVSGAGDINNDGFDDLIIGAPSADPNGSSSGTSYIIFGNNSPFAHPFELSSLDGTNGFVANGKRDSQRAFSGWSVNRAGDVNGDGIDDLIIGAQGFQGSSYVVFGDENPFSSPFELSSLDGSDGFVINGVGDRGNSGFSVSSAGDINGDGVDDLIIGAPRNSPNDNYRSGSSYVVLGSRDGFDASLELSSLDGTNGFTLHGAGARQYAGQSVSGGGDFNGDGLDDVIIGSHRTAQKGFGTGSTYVIFDVMPPVLTPIGAQTGDEGVEINFAVSATDVHSKPLTFSLDDASQEKDMAINPATGIFSWTPDGSQGGEHQVTITVSDGTYTDSETITVTVNKAPVLGEIGTQVLDNGSELRFTASATDTDSEVLTFSLDDSSGQKGMTIDSSTGEFRWTPDETQRGEHQVIFSVSDGSLSDSETVTIIVNGAPELAEIAPQTGDAGALLSFTATASDADANNTLTFSIDNEAQDKGMTIDATTGQFRWTPTLEQPGTHQVTVTVSDGSLTDSQLVTLTIRVITSITDDLASTVQLYPNPANERVHLTFTGQLSGAGGHVHITDLQGKTLLQHVFEKSNGPLEIEMDLSTLNTGVYIVELRDKEESILAKKRMVKQ